jgi:hypothetical protein
LVCQWFANFLGAISKEQYSQMNIIRSVEQNGTIAPCALNYLGEIPSQFLYLNQHARRHPLGIYNVSLEQVEKDFDKLLTRYFESLKFLRGNIHIDGNLIKDNLNEGYDDLLLAQKGVIHSLRAHIDDCYSVLATFIDPTNISGKPANTNFTDRWLKSLNFSSLGSFNDSISSYKNDYLAPLVNGLKHRQSRLRGLFFYKYDDVRIGYYLEDSDIDGIPGPSPNVHKDRNSAFSFGRDILFNLYHVYFISEMLVEAVKAALEHYHSYSLKPRSVESRSEIWLKILRQVSEIRPSAFPDEIERPFACLTFADKGEQSSFFLRYPVLMFPPRFPQGMRVMSTIHLDGVGLTYKLPYLQMSRYGGVR